MYNYWSAFYVMTKSTSQTNSISLYTCANQADALYSYSVIVPMHSTRFSKGKLNSLFNVFAYLI